MTAPRLEILDANVSRERMRWEEIFESWPQREVFAHPAYVSLFARSPDRPLAALMEFERGTVLYPFVLRRLDERWTDLTTPYGYGGPFVTRGALGRDETNVFWHSMDDWTKGVGGVSEFVRFSLFEDHLLRYAGERVQRLFNVVLRLDLESVDLLWTEYDHKVRKNVNRAKRSGVSIEIDTRADRLGEFLKIYESTMTRRGASEGYYFSRAFFDAIVSTLPGQFVFAHALSNGEVISTELVLVSAETAYSFLGGTYDHAFALRPNDLLKHELFLWARQCGKRRFVLGGGQSSDDGIFRYKRAFAPSGIVPFFVGRRILDQVAYSALVDDHTARGRNRDVSWVPSEGFFPAYRSPLP